MKVKIYEYDNNISELDIPDKEIHSILVVVLSGDETGTIVFKDGSSIDFDASDCRITSYYDGLYHVMGDNIQKWIDFVPPKGKTASYARQEQFEDIEDIDE